MTHIPPVATAQSQPGLRLADQVERHRQLANGHVGEDREEAFREAVDIPGVDLEKFGEYRAKHLAS